MNDYMSMGIVPVPTSAEVEQDAELVAKIDHLASALAEAAGAARELQHLLLSWPGSVEDDSQNHT